MAIFQRSERGNQDMRPITLIRDISNHAEGSCEIHCGNTVIRCTASAENRLPPFLRGKNQGWLTAEYAMLPRATHQRTDRKSMLESGRTKEIQRLIGRALRSACDVNAFPEWQIRIDCDVIEADGGTRTAAINGAFVAMALCFEKMMERKQIKKWPLRYYIAAISCGIIDDEVRLDLEYEEDVIAQTDANFVLNDEQKLIEIQSTAEQDPFDVTQLQTMLTLSQQASDTIITLQKQCLDINKF
ncbi:MAG: ribonuclease PH [Alphaproteobacteria bacterium]|nr:ribonuclease PH [Alphaproteobacteria bacterium]